MYQVCTYVLMVIIYEYNEMGINRNGWHSWSWSSAEQGKCSFSCLRSRLRIWSRDIMCCTVLPASACSFSAPRLDPIWCLLTPGGSSPSSMFVRRRPSIIIESVPSLSGHAVACHHLKSAVTELVVLEIVRVTSAAYYYSSNTPRAKVCGTTVDMCDTDSIRRG